MYAAVLTGAVPIIAQGASLGTAALVLAPLIATELSLASVTIVVSAATWMGLALLALTLMTRVEQLRFLWMMLGTVVAVLRTTFLITDIVLGGVGGAWTIAISLIILIASQSALVLLVYQGTIDPRISPWLVETQQRASATGGVLARAGVFLASLLIVSYLRTHALSWAAFTLSVPNAVIVFLRPPRELEVQEIGARGVFEDSALNIRFRTCDLSGQISYDGGVVTRGHSTARCRRFLTGRHLSMTSNEAVQASKTTTSIPGSTPETMKAAVLRDHEVGLQIETLHMLRPKAGEVLIKVAVCGLHHSDLRVIDDVIAFPLPAVLGHEIPDTIVELGPGNEHTGLTIEQKVAGGLFMPCGQCDACASRHDELRGPFFDLNHLKDVLYDGATCLTAPDDESVAMYSMGGLAEYVVVSPTAVTPVPGIIDMVLATILDCAAMTGYEAIHRGADLRYEETTTMVATGGVGTNIIQIARAFDASRVIAVDVDDKKLAPMLDYGATAVINSVTQDAREEVSRFTGGKGVDVSFGTLGIPATQIIVLDVLVDSGRIVPIGLGAGAQTVGVEVNRTVRRSQPILGFYGAYTRQNLPTVVGLTDKGVISYRDVVSHRLPLGEAGAGYTTLHNREIQGHAVVDISLWSQTAQPRLSGPDRVPHLRASSLGL